MHDRVRIVSARELGVQSQSAARYCLRFPASWRHAPVKNRYASALELADDLARVQSGQPLRTPLSTPKSDVYRPQSARAEQAATLLGFR